MTHEKHPHLLRPYGDRLDDGIVQTAFVLPIPPSEKAKEAARELMRKMGFFDTKIATMEKAAGHYSFFIGYGRLQHTIDFATINIPEVVIDKLSRPALNQWIEENIGRPIVVYGACTGTDSHTVGIDAIMNMKGFDGDYGLERYSMFEAHNLGAQIPNEVFLDRAKAGRADAILISQVVTQRDIHIDNARHFIAHAKEMGIHGKTILVLGGPRIDHKLALELGFDAGFGPESRASDVANFVAKLLAQRLMGIGLE
ncbi:MAG: cobalamin-dependent protein [Myxococcales bacterium]|jgi:beta-lysine 5,6-aminomutase beta subunit|nr:cobalamin-dependent protein [Myxococcales bacterium]